MYKTKGADAMTLHGHTRIELTDVHTGAVEVVESDNLITNAVSDILTATAAAWNKAMLLWRGDQGYTNAPKDLVTMFLRRPAAVRHAAGQRPGHSVCPGGRGRCGHGDGRAGQRDQKHGARQRQPDRDEDRPVERRRDLRL